MQCMYCNAPRLADEAPCPRCGAPSPFAGGAMGNYRPMPQPGWGNQQMQGTYMRGTSPIPVAPFNSPAMPRPAQVAPNTHSPWPQAPIQQNSSAAPPLQKASLLPVPYQPNVETPSQQLLIMSPDLSLRETVLIPVTSVENVLSIPDGAVHVPPIYTRPRAVIPPYRIISGLLSVLIVFTLLCSGAAYYAKVSGKLAFLQQLWGDARPQNLSPVSARSLPDPPSTPDYGPAKNIINSASTASKVDPQTAIALQPSNVFAPGQIIYLTYSVHPKGTGVVIFKWYTNGILYDVTTSTPISDARNGVYTMRYTQPVEGKVELYWNGVLAIRLYFVVR